MNKLTKNSCTPALIRPCTMNESTIKYLLLTITILAYSLGGCSLPSDEEVIRDEFGIPASAETVLIKASPEEAGWFGREGLKINALFKFSDDDFKIYKEKIETEPGWQTLPPSKDFLMKMGGIKSHKEGRLRIYRELGDPIPEEGSVYNPAEEQLYEQFLQQLPLSAGNGLFQCRAAGNNIMYAPKRIVTTPEKDLNDFIFAVLDFEKKELAVKISTNY
ncbi:hypothetical protein ACFLTH_14900 [Bacteroidota bacterium]